VSELATSLFYLGAGFGFALFLATWFLARQAMRPISGRLFGVAMLAVPAGFVMLANATQASGLNSASTHLIAGGACFFVAAVLVGAGLFLTARREAAR
jgi:hypothetical protein